MVGIFVYLRLIRLLKINFHSTKLSADSCEIQAGVSREICDYRENQNQKSGAEYNEENYIDLPDTSGRIGGVLVTGQSETRVTKPGFKVY